MPNKLIMPSGTRFGRLLILEEVPERSHLGRTQWRCQCDCGEIRVVVTSRLTSGRTRSCGCLRATSYGMSKSMRGRSVNAPEYNTWLSMRGRCLNQNSASYALYGERGITICPEWDSFARFYADMGPKPSPRHSLDRIDNDGPYVHWNCRWATQSEQARNKRVTVKLTHRGQTLPLADWADLTGIHINTLRKRMQSGLTTDEILSAVHRRYTRIPLKLHR